MRQIRDELNKAKTAEIAITERSTVMIPARNWERFDSGDSAIQSGGVRSRVPARSLSAEYQRAPISTCQYHRAQRFSAKPLGPQ
jgi:hypothetical protein